MLRFRLFDMPVTVRGSFLIIAALIGLVGVGDVSQSIARIAVIFVSILIHELGHAVTARMYGSEVAIELNGLGGLTRWSVPDGHMTPGRRALVAAAGSAAGLLFGGVVWLVASQFAPFSALVAYILEILIYVNVFWGLINWLPIRPLDGGHLLESLLDKVAPNKAESIAKVVFTGTAGAALVIAISMDLIFIAVLAGWLLLSEFTMGRATPQTGLPALSYDDSAEAPPLPPRIESLEWSPPEAPDESIDPDEQSDPPAAR